MKEAYYFSHDSNARNDEKILMLMAEHGLKGYGAYWILIEMMFENSETCLYHDKIKGIAFSYNIDITELEQIISTAISEGLFVSDGTTFWSESLRRRKGRYHELKRKRSEAGKKGMAKRWGLDNKDITELKQSNNKAITELKQSNNKDITNNNKGKERKGKENINTYRAFFEDVWKMYPNKIGKGKVSDTKKKEIYKLGDEFKRCIRRYIDYVEERKKTDFPELRYQNGSTFFNSGYVDFLDENCKEPVKEKKPPLKLVFRDVLGHGGEPYESNSADKG